MATIVTIMIMMINMVDIEIMITRIMTVLVIKAMAMKETLKTGITVIRADNKNHSTKIFKLMMIIIK